MKLTVRDMTRVALFSSLICMASLILKFGGEVVVPFSVLPFMVMLAGAILGPRFCETAVWRVNLYLSAVFWLSPGLYPRSLCRRQNNFED